MAAASGKKRSENASTTPPIDVHDTWAEEIPVELAAKVSDNHRYIVECAVQAKRDGRWSLLRPRLRFSDPPPHMTVDEICLKLCAFALDDAQRHGEADRYRARLTLEQGTHRFADIRTMVDQDGEMHMVDDYIGGERGAIDALTRSQEESHTMAVRSLAAIVEATEAWKDVCVGHRDIAGAFKDMIASVGEMARKNVEAEVRLQEVQTAQKALYYEHIEQMDKQRRIGRFLDELGGPLGDMAEDLLRDLLDMKPATGERRRERKADMDGEVVQLCQFASDLDEFFNMLSEEQGTAFAGIFTSDEAKLFSVARSVSQDDEFIALFVKLEKLLGERFKGDADKLQQKIIEAVGLSSAIKLRGIFERVSRRR